jgi:hypothetical protein
MPNWNGTTLTIKGRNLQAKIEAGETMAFTKLKIGDGALGTGQSVDNLNDLVAPKQNIGISGVTPLEDGICQIHSVITNDGLASGFYVRELGVFAQDPDLGEILYAYTADGSPDYLPAAGGSVAVAEELVIHMAFANTPDITAVISLNGLVTAGQLLAHREATPLDHPDGSVTTIKITDNAVTDAKIGTRTITDTTAAATAAGTLTAKLSQLGYMIKQITGKANWYTLPALTLEAINTLIVSAAAAGKLLKLDANAKLPASITGSADGNAATATALQTARTIALSGKVTGTATSFNGGANVSIPVTAVTADSCTGNAATATNATNHIAAASDAHAATAISSTATGDVSATNVQAAIAELASEKAPKASPALTGTPTAPTAAVGTNTTQIATTAWVWNNIQSLVSGCIAAVATAAGFTYTLSANGYIKFPSWLSGLIIQWGAINTNAGDAATPVIFPIAFPNACLQVLASAVNYQSGQSNIDRVSGAAAFEWTKTGFWCATQLTVIRALAWFAVGY